MSKVTALKKAVSNTKNNTEDSKTSRLPNVEIPKEIVLAVQNLVKDQGLTMSQFWREAALFRLQTEDLQSAKEELDRIMRQIGYAENKLREIEEREHLLNERELRIEEVERSQDSLLEERLAEIDNRKAELEIESQVKKAELEDLFQKREEEYQSRIKSIEEEVRERTAEYRRYLDVEYAEKEKDLIRLEVRIEVREAIAAEKEKFWSTMYDSVVKLTRVCGALK